MSDLFQQRTAEEEVSVIEDVLSFLKLRRGRPDVTGARVAAIGCLQNDLEAKRDALKAELLEAPQIESPEAALVS